MHEAESAAVRAQIHVRYRFLKSCQVVWGSAMHNIEALEPTTGLSIPVCNVAL